MKIQKHAGPSYDVDHKGEEFMRSHSGTWFKWVEDCNLELVIDYGLKDELEWAFKLNLKDS